RACLTRAAPANRAHTGAGALPPPLPPRITPSASFPATPAPTASDALRARADGGDYVGLGPVFGTSSKGDLPPPIGVEGVSAVRKAIRIPLVAIGGIDEGNAAQVIRSGATGVAVIAAIMGRPDPEAATRTLLREIE